MRGSAGSAHVLQIKRGVRLQMQRKRGLRARVRAWQLAVALVSMASNLAAADRRLIVQARLEQRREVSPQEQLEVPGRLLRPSALDCLEIHHVARSWSLTS